MLKMTMILKQIYMIQNHDFDDSRHGFPSSPGIMTKHDYYENDDASDNDDYDNPYYHD